MGNFSLPFSNETTFTACRSSTGKLTIQSGFVMENFLPQANRLWGGKLPLISLPLAYLIYFTDTSNSVLFVTTKTRGSTSLAFEELINVFQHAVWGIALMVLVPSFIFVHKIVGSKKSLGIQSQILSLTKCLIEQGDPIRANICNSDTVKGVITGIFSASILLINAYKNNNVYNMVSPRKVLPFERLEEPESDKIPIYSTVWDVKMLRHNGFASIQREEDSVLKSFTYDSNYFDYTDYYMNSIYFDVIVTGDISFRCVRYLILVELESSISAFELFRQVRLPDKLLELSHSTADTDNKTKFAKKLHKDDDNFELLKVHLNEILLREQQRILRNELLSNRKVAVVVNASVALELRNSINDASVGFYVGKKHILGELPRIQRILRAPQKMKLRLRQFQETFW